MISEASVAKVSVTTGVYQRQVLLRFSSGCPLVSASDCAYITLFVIFTYGGSAPTQRDLLFGCRLASSSMNTLQTTPPSLVSNALDTGGDQGPVMALGNSRCHAVGETFPVSRAIAMLSLGRPNMVHFPMPRAREARGTCADMQDVLDMT